MDAVVNHMCGAAGGSGTHSTCGSYFDAGNENFPAVPYSGWDFNDGKCHTSNGEIQNYGDIYQVNFYGKTVNAFLTCSIKTTVRPQKGVGDHRFSTSPPDQ